MKYIALIIILTLSLSKAAHADIVNKMICVNVSQIAEIIMDNRQNGMGITENVAVAMRGAKTDIDDEIMTIAITAYDFKIVHENRRRDVVAQYAQNVYDVCIETNVFGTFDR